MRGNNGTIPANIRPVSAKEKVVKGRQRKFKGRTFLNTLYFIPLFLSVCGVFGPLISTIEEGFTFTVVFPMIVWTAWALAAGYSLALRRSFFNDIAPWFVAPFGVLVRLAQAIRGVGSAANWGARLVTGGITESGVLNVDDFIPQTFDNIHTVAVSRVLNRYETAVLGYNPDRLVYCDWRSAKHLIIQGETGTGKTTVALTLLMSMLKGGPGVFGKWDFYLHDAKRVIGPWFAPIRDAYPSKFHIEIEQAKGLAQIRLLYEEMQRRYDILGDNKGFEVEDVGLGRILFLVDEPQVWYDTKLYPREDALAYEAHIKHLVNLGRQAGIHVVMVSPYALASVISTEYRGNLRVVSGYLQEQNLRGASIPGVSKLNPHEFLFTEQVTQGPVWFSTFKIEPYHMDGIITTMQGQAISTPEELMLHIFATTPECGYRKIQRIGVHEVNARHSAGMVDEVWFPWSAIKLETDEQGREKPMPSHSAENWVRETMGFFINAGIAQNQGAGRPHKFLSRDFSQALRQWRAYVEQNPIVRS